MFWFWFVIVSSLIIIALTYLVLHWINNILELLKFLILIVQYYYTSTALVLFKFLSTALKRTLYIYKYIYLIIFALSITILEQ